MRVLASFPQPRARTNPYVVMLADALRNTGEVQLDTFTWARALRGRYDVFHVHWPELLLRSGVGWKTVARHLLFAVFLGMLRLRGTAVVRTAHNVAPHEPPPLPSRVLLSRLDRMTDMWVILNPHTRVPGPSMLIPHGHYVDWYSGRPTREVQKGLVVFAGLIRPYKNVDGLVAAFAGLPGAEPRLRVAGQPSPPGGELEADLRAAAAEDARVELRLGYLDDAELVAEVTAASLVALPYSEMHNSGAALMALSLARRVLLPATPVNRELADEVGAGWVLLYDGLVTAEVLGAALDQPPPTGAPDLAARAWDRAGARHVAAYRAARAGRVSDRRRCG